MKQQLIGVIPLAEAAIRAISPKTQGLCLVEYIKKHHASFIWALHLVSVHNMRIATMGSDA